MIQLDSRSSRMSPDQALLTLHADYIGGEHANYRKWYFAAQLDLDDAIGAAQNPGLSRVKSVRSKKKPITASAKSLDSAVSRWRTAMNNMSQYDRLRQVALYLLCWSIVKPLYRFLRDQGYEVVDGKFLRRERDHHEIIGYDDVNQLFWYPEGIARIQLADKVRINDL
jgi:1,3-beta-glucan synthase